MKKTMTIVLIFIMSLLLVACGNKSTLEKDIVVIFFTDGGTRIPRIVNPELGSTVSRPDDPEKVGYVFDDWYKDFERLVLWDFDTDTIEESVTIFAKFDVIHYDIIYHIMPGEDLGTNVLTYTIDRDVFLRETTLEGYTFNGWYKEAEFTNKIDRIPKGTYGDFHVYSKLSYKLSFDTLYLAVPRVILVDPNTEIIKNSTNNSILNPTRNGYSFGGWYLIDTRDYVANGETPPEEYLVDFEGKTITEELKVYAYWIKN